MPNTIESLLAKLVEQLYNDENGISADAHYTLLTLLDKLTNELHLDPFEVYRLIGRVVATDDRFYLP